MKRAPHRGVFAGTTVALFVGSALAAQVDPGIVDALRALRGNDALAAAAASSALERMGPAAVAPLVQALHDESRLMRSRSALALTGLALDNPGARPRSWPPWTRAARPIRRSASRPGSSGSSWPSRCSSSSSSASSRA